MTHSHQIQKGKWKQKNIYSYIFKETYIYSLGAFSS